MSRFFSEKYKDLTPYTVMQQKFTYLQPRYECAPKYIFNEAVTRERLRYLAAKDSPLVSYSCLAKGGYEIGYIKLKVIVMVMRELNIVTIDELEDEVYRFGIHYSSSKTDLDKSNLLRRLRSQLARD